MRGIYKQVTFFESLARWDARTTVCQHNVGAGRLFRAYKSPVLAVFQAPRPRTAPHIGSVMMLSKVRGTCPAS